MPEKFPEVLPPKGSGRVDSSHRVAVLTEPEIGALNFLKNMDKAMGYKSGFSPMMQNLAAQNKEPLQYVEYRGERIPSLNGYEAEESYQSSGGYGGGFNDSNDSGGGNDSEDWYKNWLKGEEERIRKERAQMLADEEYIERMEAGYNYHDEGVEGNNYETANYDAEGNTIGEGDYHDTFGNVEGSYDPEVADLYNDPNSTHVDNGDGTTTVTNSNGETVTVDDDGTVVPEPEPVVYTDWEGEGNYTTQAEADARNKELMGIARDSAYNISQDYLGTEYGSEYGDEVGADVDAYVNSFGDELNLAYEQAQDGLYDTQAQSGVWNQEGYNESLDALNTALGSERDALGAYGDQYRANYTNAKNTWKTEQDAAADALYNMNNQEGYDLLKKHGLGYYDEDGEQKHGLDLSSFKDNQEFGGDFSGDDYDFLGEFNKITPTGEKIHATTIPSEETETTGTGTTESGSGGSTSKTKKKKKKKYRTTANTPLTGSGSSTNIN